MLSLKAKLIQMLKSDAVPRPPRPESVAAEPTSTDPEEENSENDGFNSQEEEASQPEYSKKESKKPKFNKFFSPGKKKNDDPPNFESSKDGKDEIAINTQATGDVINIVNATGLHWGTSNVYYLGTSGNKKNDDPFEEKIEKTNLITLLMESKLKPEHEYIDYISKNLGKNWHSIFRKLGYTKGRIETVEMEQAKYGVSEARYKLLYDWVRNEDDCTLGRLATLLWEEGERQVVKELSLIYKKGQK